MAAEAVGLVDLSRKPAPAGRSRSGDDPVTPPPDQRGIAAG
jgi:hypothetical protein